MTPITLDWSARIYSPNYLVQLLRDAEDVCREDGEQLVAVVVHPRTLRQYQESIPGWVEWFMAAPVMVGPVRLIEGPAPRTPEAGWRRCVNRERIDAPF